MESRVIQLTEADIKNDKLNIRPCGEGFFPKDAVGGSTKASPGVPITIIATGITEPVKTDIPREKNCDRVRWFFRERKWVRRFVRANSLIPGDRVSIRRMDNRTYELIPHKRKFTFIDLFAGIGGTRLAFEKAGCECVFSSEWDKFAQQTYEANFGEKPRGNIREIPTSEIPDHDILVAGFPCQPFSISGVSKKKALGRPHGFQDVTQGTLFFEIKRILRDKKTPVFLLENVKHLKRHDKGNTYRVILDTLEKELGYTIFDKVLDADAYVPQHRERIFIVGFREPAFFTFPHYEPRVKPKFRDIIDKDVPEKYTLTDHLWNYLQEYAKKHREKGNGFQYGLTDLDGRARTLSARYYKDGAEVLVPQGKNKNPRRLTPKECANLMGFTQLNPDFKIPVSDTQAYKQFGNAVVVPLVYDIAKAIVRCVRKKTT
ncbi:MAG TPA: DNA (cytosine-5-)-methyltransferase [Sedimentisphaerales bacterium]|nr:DNA (cytosine-5-)-methyltransferase [Sedimentisphaerales bacterium]